MSDKPTTMTQPGDQLSWGEINEGCIPTTPDPRIEPVREHFQETFVTGWYESVEAPVRQAIDTLIAEHPVLSKLPKRLREDMAYRASVAIYRAPTWDQMARALLLRLEEISNAST